MVERWIPQLRIRQDLFGWADAVAIREDQDGVLFLQFTTTGNMVSRIKKIISSEKAKIVLAANNRIEVWGWSKRGEHDKRKLWTVKRVPILYTFIDGMHAGEATVER